MQKKSRTLTKVRLLCHEKGGRNQSLGKGKTVTLPSTRGAFTLLGWLEEKQLVKDRLGKENNNLLLLKRKEVVLTVIREKRARSGPGREKMYFS